MAVKRIIDEKVADERTYEKLRRDLDVLPANHPDRARIQAEHNAVKARLAVRHP